VLSGIGGNRRTKLLDFSFFVHLRALSFFSWWILSLVHTHRLRGKERKTLKQPTDLGRRRKGKRGERRSEAAPSASRFPSRVLDDLVDQQRLSTTHVEAVLKSDGQRPAEKTRKAGGVSEISGTG
jgi:hypothetical protein